MLDNVSMEWSEPISVIELNEIESVKEMKNKKHQLLETIFQNSPKEVKHKEIKVIDYNKVNRITNTNTTSVLGGAIRKAKLENLKKNYRGR
jgi:hypothetical protein